MAGKLRSRRQKDDIAIAACAIAHGASMRWRLAFRLFCHGIPDRCIDLWGVPMPICARCTAIYAGLAVSLLIFFGAVVGLLLIGPFFSKPIELVGDGVAALLAGTWCALNFWRSRHAHCVVTAVGWLGLAPFTFVEATIGRSLIGGNEQLVFLAVLFAGLGFEAAWYVRLRTNAVQPR